MLYPRHRRQTWEIPSFTRCHLTRWLGPRTVLGARLPAEAALARVTQPLPTPRPFSVFHVSCLKNTGLDLTDLTGSLRGLSDVSRITCGLSAQGEDAW